MNIEQIYEQQQKFIKKTPLQYSSKLSQKIKGNVYFKREDLNIVRSFKIRGGLNKILNLTQEQKQKGLICASAGNHSQAFAYICCLLQIQGLIYMPQNVQQIKLKNVINIGKQFVKIVLFGQTLNDSIEEARKECELQGKTFIHPYDDIDIIKGNSTISLEIQKQLQKNNQTIDFLFCQLGGGGLLSGQLLFRESQDKKYNIVACQSKTAPSMYNAFLHGKPFEQKQISTFFDGGSMTKTGETTFKICSDFLPISDLLLIDEEIKEDFRYMLEEEGILCETTSLLVIKAFQQKIKENIQQFEGKTVVLIISGSNIGIERVKTLLE